jgi:hypothetical protein
MNVAAVVNAATARRERKMSECEEKQLVLIKPTESSAVDPNIFIETRIPVPKSKSGLAIPRTVKTLQGRILMMVAKSRLFKDASPGAEVVANASIYLFDSDDGEPVRLEPVGWLAI